MSIPDQAAGISPNQYQQLPFGWDWAPRSSALSLAGPARCTGTRGRRRLPAFSWGVGWHGDTRASLPLLPPFPFGLLSLCEILPQKNREVLRARSHVRGEQASLCRALQGEEARPGLLGTQRACALSVWGSGPAPVLPVRRGLHWHIRNLLPPPTRRWTKSGDPHWVPSGSPIPKPISALKQSLSPKPFSHFPFRAAPPSLHHPCGTPPPSHNAPSASRLLPPSRPGHHPHSEPPCCPEKPPGAGTSPAASGLLKCSGCRTSSALRRCLKNSSSMPEATAHPETLLLIKYSMQASDQNKIATMNWVLTMCQAPLGADT